MANRESIDDTYQRLALDGVLSVRSPVIETSVSLDIQNFEAELRTHISNHRPSYLTYFRRIATDNPDLGLPSVSASWVWGVLASAAEKKAASYQNDVLTNPNSAEKFAIWYEYITGVTRVCNAVLMASEPNTSLADEEAATLSDPDLSESDAIEFSLNLESLLRRNRDLFQTDQTGQLLIASVIGDIRSQLDQRLEDRFNVPSGYVLQGAQAAARFYTIACELSEG